MDTTKPSMDPATAHLLVDALVKLEAHLSIYGHTEPDKDAVRVVARDHARSVLALVDVSASGTASIGAYAIATIAEEMRGRRINHGRDRSGTLSAWADRLDAALVNMGLRPGSALRP